MREASFRQTYGGDLTAAWECIQGYTQLMASKFLNVPTCGGIPDAANANNSEHLLLHQAWNHYLNAFKRINLAISQTLSLELSSSSPKLHTALDLEVGVPGTYSVKGEAVRIKSFHEVVCIIRSKQRPRKIKVHGEDGQVYVFLLKASSLVLSSLIFGLF